jgi:hypothetical protein
VEEVPGHDIRGIAYELHINEGLIAIALAHFDSILRPPKYQIFLLELEGGRQKLLDINVPTVGHSIPFQDTFAHEAR